MHNICEVTNITELRDSLLDVFNGLVNNTIEQKYATEVNNTAGKIISTMKVQLAYHAMRQETPIIKFLDSESTTKRIKNSNIREIPK